MANRFHPDLAAARWIPPFSWSPRVARFMRNQKPRPVDPGEGVTVDGVTVSPTVSLRFFRPTDATGPVPVLLWMHGGGHLFGSPEQDDQSNIAFVRELGIAVAAVLYRLGADAPAPASVDDVYAALAFVKERAGELGVDPSRIAVGGASAGGGVAAGLVLAVHDRGEITIAFQLLVYPMLDDRTVLRTDLDDLPVRIWSRKSNRLGWRTYLGVEPGASGVSPYTAAARRDDLTGLPPTWIGVGDLDLFHDEDVMYAQRLQAAGVACELVVVPGAFHGFDAVFTTKPVTKAFWQSQADALRRAGIVGG